MNLDGKFSCAVLFTMYCLTINIKANTLAYFPQIKHSITGPKAAKLASSSADKAKIYNYHKLYSPLVWFLTNP